MNIKQITFSPTGGTKKVASGCILDLMTQTLSRVVKPRFWMNSEESEMKLDRK